MTGSEDSTCLADKLGVGDVVGGKYLIDALLGRGGMGLVASAQHMQLKERVALKFLTGAADRVPAARSRFLREARVTAKLRGEHAARVSDFGVLDDGTPYMVMEFLEGTDLRQIIREHGALPVDVAVHYVAQACEGLAEAHALGIVHRDLKPSNLFLTRRPDGTDLIKIVDFGVSKMRSAQEADDELTAAGSILGSPKYMAPEQLRNSEKADSRADIWSLGAILYELLSGRPPFQAESTASLCYLILSDAAPESLVGQAEGVTPELEAVVMRCLERDIDARTQDVARLVADLFEATATVGLDKVAESIGGILGRAARELSQTGGGAFGTSGGYPRTRLNRDLTTSDSGSQRKRESSSESGAGGVASSEVGRRRRSSMIIPGVLLVAVLGAAGVLWARASSAPAMTETSAPATEAIEAASPPAASSAVATAAATQNADSADAASEAAAAAADVDAGPADAKSEATATSRRWSPPARTTPPRSTATKEPPAPKDPKKPRDPFNDRY